MYYIRDLCCSAASKIPLNQLAKMSATASMTTSGTTTTSLLDAGNMTATTLSVSEVQPLTDVIVPLETIQPG